MSDQQAFLERIVAELDAAGVPYMVCGSLASGLHGSPRATNDIDLVIDPSIESLERLIDALEKDFYVDRGAAREAMRSRRMFNVIQAETGWKVDLVLRKQREFSSAEFARRLRVPMLGREYFVATPEDTILSKLEWAKASGSDRQLDDAMGVVAVQPDLDLVYLQRWSEALGVEDLLARVLDPDSRS